MCTADHVCKRELNLHETRPVNSKHKLNGVSKCSRVIEFSVYPPHPHPNPMAQLFLW